MEKLGYYYTERQNEVVEYLTFSWIQHEWGTYNSRHVFDSSTTNTLATSDLFL